jgi:hypothetical protein
LLGLLLAVPILAERALLVIDDDNWSAVRQAAWDFWASRPEGQLLLSKSANVFSQGSGGW